MTKVHTSLNVDVETLKKAKLMGINISAALDEKLREKLEILEVEIDRSQNESRCELCGIEELKATVDNLNGLTWLYPDEKWICHECLEIKKRSVGIY